MKQDVVVLTATPDRVAALIAMTAGNLLRMERGRIHERAPEGARPDRVDRIEAAAQRQLDARRIIRDVIEALDQPTEIQSPAGPLPVPGSDEDRYRATVAGYNRHVEPADESVVRVERWLRTGADAVSSTR